jgi:hypothetical protein
MPFGGGSFLDPLQVTVAFWPKHFASVHMSGLSNDSKMSRSTPVRFGHSPHAPAPSNERGVREVEGRVLELEHDVALEPALEVAHAHRPGRCRRSATPSWLPSGP